MLQPRNLRFGFLFFDETKKMFSLNDEKWMRRAMELAQRGEGMVNPNPLVGAVIVLDGRVLAEGWHERWGGLHAERNALRNCGGTAAGATMYVTLEPCCHYGKTPPCTDAIIAAGISRVVVGIMDPNPLVAGKGVRQLEKAGIEVECGLLEKELRRQNRVFLRYMTTGLPWVTLKTAMTLDGKIASKTGDSRWVTGEKSRRRVHEMRRSNMAVLTGVGTVRADNPLLNCRLDDCPRQPLRIVADSSASLSLDSRIVSTAREYRTVIAHTGRADRQKVDRLHEAGVETWECAEENGHVSVGDLLRIAGKAGIDSILLESGGSLNGSFIDGGFVDEAAVFIAPKIIGGSESMTPVAGFGIGCMNDAAGLEDVVVERVGDDILINGIIKK